MAAAGQASTQAGVYDAGARGRAGRRLGVLRRLQSMAAEAALLDDAARPRRDLGVERLGELARPVRIPPVEGARVVGAGRHAVAAAEAAHRDLRDDARGGIDLDGVLRADGSAGRLVAALLAQHRHERGPRVARALDLVHAQPGDAVALGRALVARAARCSRPRRPPCTRRSRCSGRGRSPFRSARRAGSRGLSMLRPPGPGRGSLARCRLPARRRQAVRPGPWCSSPDAARPGRGRPRVPCGPAAAAGRSAARAVTLPAALSIRTRWPSSRSRRSAVLGLIAAVAAAARRSDSW